MKTDLWEQIRKSTGKDKNRILEKNALISPKGQLVFGHKMILEPRWPGKGSHENVSMGANS